MSKILETVSVDMDCGSLVEPRASSPGSRGQSLQAAENLLFIRDPSDSSGRTSKLSLPLAALSLLSVVNAFTKLLAGNTMEWTEDFSDEHASLHLIVSDKIPMNCRRGRVLD